MLSRVAVKSYHALIWSFIRLQNGNQPKSYQECGSHSGQWLAIGNMQQYMAIQKAFALRLRLGNLSGAVVVWAVNNTSLQHYGKRSSTGLTAEGTALCAQVYWLRKGRGFQRGFPKSQG
jgi:hypothetical protein